MEDLGINKFLTYFFSIYNPIFLAIIFFLLLFVVIYISYRHIYNPLIRQHRKEKESLELKNARLLTLFSELDPNPIIKVNPLGLIVGTNKSAKEKFHLDQSSGKDITTLLDEHQINFDDLIKENKSIVISKVIKNKHYEINIYGITLLDMAQLYFYDITEKKEHLEQMNAYQKLLKESSAKSLRDLEEEKSRIAALLHDSIGQNLLLIKLGMQNIIRRLNGSHLEEEYIPTLRLLDSTIQEAKDISRRIRPLNLDELGLGTVLVSLCKTIAKESHLTYQLNLPVDPVSLDKNLELCIYRVVQEALNNIIKHSKAGKFAVSLNTENNAVSLMISDNGTGFKPSILLNDKYISEGLGIINMQERIERLNGIFHIDSTIDEGTIIIAYFPLSEKANGEPYHKNISG